MAGIEKDIESPGPHVRGRFEAEGRIKPRSMRFGGRKTSLKLEPEFWDALHDIARRRGLPMSVIAAEVAAANAGGNLSATLRVYVTKFYQALAQGE